LDLSRRGATQLSRVLLSVLKKWERQTVNETGAVVTYNNYDPYGNPTDPSPGTPPFGFTGEWWQDDLDLLTLPDVIVTESSSGKMRYLLADGLGFVRHAALAQWRFPDNAKFSTWVAGQIRNAGLPDEKQITDAETRTNRNIVLVEFQSANSDRND